LLGYYAYYIAAVGLLMPVPFIFGSHGRLRDSVWLWLYLSTYTKPLNTEWQPVFDGNAISDAQVSFNLDVGVETVRRWRQRLERLGYIRTEVARPRFRRYCLGRPGSPEQSLVATPVSEAVN